MPQHELEGVIRIITSVESSSCDSAGSDGHGAGSPHGSGNSQDGDAEEYAEPDDDAAVCNLIKGTALRELGKLDEAQKCLEFVREDTCYIETELFVIPMAAYERALLLIMKFSQTAAEHPEKAPDFAVLLKVLGTKNRRFIPEVRT
eukprot:TRINITY_DN6275_c0_g1_i1.p1 TRINITY_DN6275_c0_g1~~TRINITY_DN6275_c0_g1_i1.p1  ORF type:complete len:146 (+),score=25.99 TRINITY_DN6275_c0_g1_i1:197-634(+)